MLVKLSNTITRESELRKLGVMGFHLETEEIDTHIMNNSDIASAAYHVLSEWRNQQEDHKVAYNILCDALRKVNMELMIQDFI